MRRAFPSWATAAAAVAALTVVGAFVAVPLIVRAPLGLLTVFVLPGFAVERALHPGTAIDPTEHPFFWLGISLAVSVVTALALAASPIGLSREWLAVVLGSGSGLMSMLAGVRAMTSVVSPEVEDRV